MECRKDHSLGTRKPCLPDPPERPLDSDCCGNNCDPCVMDIYHEEVALWEAECEKILCGESNKEGAHKHPQIDLESDLHPDMYRDFYIVSVLQETSDIIRVRCRLSKNQTLGLSVGQHIIVRAKTEDGYITRQYTPVSPIEIKGYFELLIKIYETGRMSQIMKTWKAGDKLQARGPAGHFKYSRNQFPRILMLCGGTGVAPMCQVVSSVLADEEDETCLRLVYACQSYKQLMAKSEIDEWRRFWNFSCVFMLSQEPEFPEYSYKYGEEICKGYIDSDTVIREVGSSIDRILVLVCGTRSFDADMMKCLKDIGVPETNIHKF